MSLQQSISGWVALLKRELAEADQNAKKAQFQAWSKFALHPDFPQVGQDVFKGWIDNRYLDWTSINMTLYLKPVRPGFWTRIGPAFRWLFTGSKPMAIGKLVYEMAEKGEKGSVMVTVNFKKNKEQVTSDFSIRKRKLA